MAKKKIPSIPPGEARFRDPQDRDFTIMPNVVFFGYPGLSAGARWLYYLLRAYAWGDKAYSYPTIGGLAKTQGVSEVTLGKRLKELTQVKLITVERQRGFRNLYWIEPLPNTPQAGLRGQGSLGGQYLNRQLNNELKQDENEKTALTVSLSLSEIAEKYERPHKRKGFLTTLSKYPLDVVNEVIAATEDQIDRHGDSAIETPVAYISSLLPIFAEQQHERQVAEAEEQREQFKGILATAAFYCQDGRRDIDSVKGKLLGDFPGQEKLVEQALERVKEQLGLNR